MTVAIPALLKDTLSGLLDLLYPPKCAVCQQIGPDVICGRCRAGFGGFEGEVCKKCGGAKRNGACRNCSDGIPRYITKARAAGRFEGSLRDAIHKFKYPGKRKLAGPLGGFLEEYLLDKPFGKVAFDVVIPVPLHVSRLRERDFNQAELLAEVAASYLELPLLRDAMVRTRHTKRQADLHAKERMKNVHGAFAVRDGGPIMGKCMLLVDDVVTTCATTDECARMLLEAGAKSVYVISLARDV
jgi:ComF family protein